MKSRPLSEAEVTPKARHSWRPGSPRAIPHQMPSAVLRASLKSDGSGAHTPWQRTPAGHRPDSSRAIPHQVPSAALRASLKRDGHGAYAPLAAGSGRLPARADENTTLAATGDLPHITAEVTKSA